MCKYYKYAGYGDDERMPVAALRQFGAVNPGRVTRHDVDEAEALPWEPGPAVVPWRSRKDTKRWCKGKTGREHVPRLIVKGYNSDFTCGPGWDGRWRCYHREACAVCGKILGDRIPAGSCPDRVKGGERPSASPAHV